MKKEIQHRNIFHLTSLITDHFPKAGSRVLDLSIKFIFGNKILYNFLFKKIELVIGKKKVFKKFLVVADLNIGDAIICSSGVIALRKLFPKAEIDYVIKKSTKCLLEGNPDISNLYSLYDGSPYPTESDLEGLAYLAGNKNYDLIINYSPMINDKIFGNNRVINYSLMVAELIRNEKYKSRINNISYQAYGFIKNIFGDLLIADYEDEFKGPKVYISDEAIENADNLLLNHNISADRPIVFFNPDATSKFTRMPFELQLELLHKIADLNCMILLGEGHVEKNIVNKLLMSLRDEVIEKIIVVPRSFNLDDYAALIDLSDIFITGDTGPLHLAAARKYSRDHGNSLRNKTAIFSIFGSTPPRMYGFDSETQGFFAANQEAPSRTFIAQSPCRNISCINKSAKTCSQVRCFWELDTDNIIAEIADYIFAPQSSRSIKSTSTLLNKM